VTPDAYAQRLAEVGETAATRLHAGTDPGDVLAYVLDRLRNIDGRPAELALAGLLMVVLWHAPTHEPWEQIRARRPAPASGDGGSTDLDWARVERVLDGDRGQAAVLSAAERAEVLRVGRARGLTATQLADLLGRTRRTVHRQQKEAAV
jgi:hypothetical protein